MARSHPDLVEVLGATVVALSIATVLMLWYL
jgi:hypothetical protein